MLWNDFGMLWNVFGTSYKTCFIIELSLFYLETKNTETTKCKFQLVSPQRFILS